MALMPVAEAMAAVLDGVTALPEEMVPLRLAHHRVLSRDLASRRTQPPADMSAMDGYAVRASDAATIPARLRVIGEAAAGKPFDAVLKAGEAVRIFTGGVVPHGADAVVIQEDTTRDGDTVIVNEAAATGRHIRRAGLDFREGDILLRAGDRLTDRHLSLAAGMNHAQLPVHRRPRIAVLATGDELVQPGATPGPGQIVLSNGFALHALAASESAETIDLGIAADTLESTTAAIRQARDSGVDILVTTGGASVGDHDLMHVALQAEGVDLAFWKIALRPGKPMMQGRLGGMRVILRLRLPVHDAADSCPVRPPRRRARRRGRNSGQRPARERSTAGLPACPDRAARRRCHRGDHGEPSGQFAAGESGAGASLDHPSAPRTRRRRR